MRFNRSARRLRESDRRFRRGAGLCDAQVAAHEDSFPVERSDVAERTHRCRNRRKAGAQREVRGEARAIDAVRRGNVRAGGIAGTVAGYENSLHACSAAQFDGQ